MRDIDAIFSDLQLSSLKNKKMAEHLEKIRYFLRANDHAKLLLAINEGVSKFKSSNPITFLSSGSSNYANFLLELQNHFMVTSPENKETRLRNLLTAIEGNDEITVKQMLNRGSAIVVNETSRDGVLPLVAALKNKNRAVINLLIQKGATLDNVQDVNQPINDKGDTLLHIASELGLNYLVVDLLSRQADVNRKNADGATPLHSAIEHSQIEIAGLLLNKKADPHIQYDALPKDQNAFLMALHKRAYQLARHMLTMGYRVREVDVRYLKELKKRDDNPTAEILYTEMKRPLRAAKNDIMFNSRKGEKQLFDTMSNRIRGHENLFRQLYYAESKEKILIAMGLLHIHGHENSILKPLITGLELAMNIPVDESEKRKALKILINTENTTDTLTGEANASGLYKNKNTIYVSAGNGLSSTFATLLHEVKHYMDKQIYGDSKTPYNDSSKDEFMLVKELLKNNLPTLPQETPNDRHIYQSIAGIFSRYAEEDQDAEILVKVPEIIGYLGMEEGYSWLKQNTPYLLNYYERRFNPACEAYVAKMQDKLAEKTAIYDVEDKIFPKLI